MAQIDWKNIDNERQIELLKGEIAKDVEEYKHQRELHRINARGVLDFALGAIRATILVNGAAVAGLLTFIGNRGATSAGEQLRLSLAMGAFAIGVGLGLATACVAYLAQLELTWGEPEDGRGESRLSVKARWTGIGLAAGAAALFFIGVGLAIDAFI